MREFTAVSLFCGAGGLDMGFDRAGFKTIWANDFEEDACKTHREWSNADVVWGDIGKIKADDIPKSDVMLGGFPCFTGNTAVLTNDGYKDISKICINDYVIGHDGNAHIVTNVYNNGKKKIWNLLPVCTDVIHTTENHLFWARQRSGKETTSPKWMTAKEISEFKSTVYIGTPINKNSIVPAWSGCDIKKNQFTEKHVNTLDMNDGLLWYLVGRYLGDGWLAKSHGRPHYAKVIIACGEHKVEHFEKLMSNFKIKYTKAKERTVTKYHFSSVELANFFSLFGQGAFNKHLPGFVYDLPVCLLEKLIEGYFDSDGHQKGNSKCITSVNKNILLEMSQCIMKVYKVPVSIRCDKMNNSNIIEGRVVNQHDSYVLSWWPNGQQKSSFYEDGYVWYCVHKVEETDRYEEVFDITVDGSHSFIAENCAAHNCQGFSLSGPRKIDDKRNKLYHHYVRILKDKQPLVFIGENVKGLLTMADGEIFEAIVEDFSNCGYDVFTTLVNAKDYGVPQDRERVIIVGFRKDLNITDFNISEYTGNSVTLKDAIGDFEEPMPEDVCVAPFSSRYMSRNRKRGWDQVSYTIPAMAKQVTLWPGSPDMIKLGKDKWKFGDGFTRRFSYQEAAAIQTFPKDMVFYGDLTSKYKQIGNAVPVLLAEHVAKDIRRILEEKLSEE